MAATIEIRPNGPLRVKGEVALESSKGEPIAAEAEVFLCRCGGSANKPFCDGTHKRNGFSGARVSDGSEDRVTRYRGPAVVIHDNRSLCSHLGHCTDGLPAVFREEGTPWIEAGGADAKSVVAAVHRCPSGALAAEVEGRIVEPPARAPAIRVSKDGPYQVSGAVELLDVRWGEGASRSRFTLCRCGASKNKPFCDGSHWDAQFKDEKN